jgi:hypothetical protein
MTADGHTKHIYGYMVENTPLLELECTRTVKYPVLKKSKTRKLGAGTLAWALGAD